MEGKDYNLTDLDNVSPSDMDSDTERKSPAENEACADNPVHENTTFSPSALLQESYTVFLVHSDADAEFVESVMDTLEQRGVSCCYPKRDFRPGKTTVSCIDEALNRSKFVILFLSNDFLTRCKHERNMVLHKATEESKNIVVPILMDVHVKDLPRNIWRLTHIKKDDNCFQNRLLFALGVQSSIDDHRPTYSELEKLIQHLKILDELCSEIIHEVMQSSGRCDLGRQHIDSEAQTAAKRRHEQSSTVVRSLGRIEGQTAAGRRREQRSIDIQIFGRSEGQTAAGRRREQRCTVIAVIIFSALVALFVILTFVILLMSNDSKTGPWCKHERDMTLDKATEESEDIVVPILVDVDVNDQPTNIWRLTRIKKDDNCFQNRLIFALRVQASIDYHRPTYTELEASNMELKSKLEDSRRLNDVNKELQRQCKDLQEKVHRIEVQRRHAYSKYQSLLRQHTADNTFVTEQRLLSDPQLLASVGGAIIIQKIYGPPTCIPITPALSETEPTQSNLTQQHS